MALYRNALPVRAQHAAPSRLTVSFTPATVRPCRRFFVRAAAQPDGPQEFGLAPAKPKTAYGEMLQYYLKMEPQLFKAAVESQLARLQEEREAKEAQARALEESSSAAGGSEQQAKDTAELALYRRMEEVRASEVRSTLEDLMYVSILERFLMLGVDMLPRMDGLVEPGPVSLKALTEGIHSREALELVREHLMSVMGAASNAFSNQMIKISKFQMAQVYATSIMFGYWLRRVDARFKLDQQFGSLAVSQEDAVARLERLFAQADSIDEADNPDYVAPGTVYDVEAPGSPAGAVGAPAAADDPPAPPSGLARKAKSALRQYIERFDQAMMVDMARIVSQEGAGLVERQTTALFGDIKQLTQQMQEACRDVGSAEELMQRMVEVVADDRVPTLKMSVNTQRRAVLEAVSFGAFLRDVESQVQQDYNLLTPLPAPRLPGMM